jgi:LmbE family N-acetylglucosaminyl deacetylase
LTHPLHKIGSYRESYGEPAQGGHARAPRVLVDHAPLADDDGQARLRNDDRRARLADDDARPSLATGRIVIVSPHLDDAVMSLGATITRAVRSGARVEVLTVFGCEPLSTGAAGMWDHKSGFRTEGEASRARRLEDSRACGVLGATPRWLDFGGEPYERRASAHEIRSAVIGAIAGADCALLPGFPLVHHDHAELSRLLLSARLPCRVALYAEQPYVFYARKDWRPAMRAAAIERQLNGPLHWTHRLPDRRERRMKMRAVRCYRSQMWQLGLSHIGLYRMMWHEASLGGEAIAWLPRSYGDAPITRSERSRWKASRPLPGGGNRAPAGALPLDE